MPENLIAPDADESSGPGATLRLVSLAPRFRERRHRVYVNLLRRAIAHDRVRNIAITGPYGSGKSSVIEHLGEDPAYSSRLLQLSLSTIAPRRTSAPPADTDGGESDTAGTQRTNEIQKEIVKQLLYTTTPEQVPQSRYRRNSVPDRTKNWLLATGLGLTTFGLVILLGPLQPLVTEWFEGTARQNLAYAVLAALFVGAFWIILSIARARPAVSASVNAAATTINIDTNAGTYFDHYLDEIVYVFQVTQRDIVIIEDIDRFEDIEIFDTLRALNGLLNASSQIGRRVVFVYAIRDSVFEQIGGDQGNRPPEHNTALNDHAKRAVQRASRTKFFDVIIPIVPFVSADNARDIMSRTMKSPEFKISPALIRLAARHVADMRMIHNIRNEFEVYRHQLVVPKSKLPDITDDLVFAIVLYKNTHLSDFEKIRFKDSSLDRLYGAWRKLVQENVASISHQVAQLDDASERQRRVGTHARRLADKLRLFVEDMDLAAPADTDVTLPSDLTELDSPTSWAEIAAADGIVLTMSTPRAGTESQLAYSKAALDRILGEDIDPARWLESDLEAANQPRQPLVDKLRFLKHHSWMQAHDRSDFSIAAIKLDLSGEESARWTSMERGENATFSNLVDTILTSELARDLVRGGFLTSHFASYASIYYGEHLGREAREYIYRFMDPGVPDFTYALSSRDVRQILREQGAGQDDRAEVFRDPSILNVHILDYLLKRRPQAAVAVINELASSAVRDEFLDIYMSQGKEKHRLVASLTARWPEVLGYVATAPSISPDDRVALMDAALVALPSTDLVLDPVVVEFLEANYQDIAAITSPRSEERALTNLGLLSRSGAEVEDLSSLNDAALAAAIDFKAYPVSARNLRAIGFTGKIGLDSLRLNAPVYQHVLADLATYVQMCESLPREFAIIVDPERLTEVLSDIQPIEETVTQRLIARADPAARVKSLSSVGIHFWPTLAAAQRTPPTFANVQIYVSEIGVDANLRILLKGRRVLETRAVAVGARRALAYEILKSRESIPSTLARTQIAARLVPGVLAPGSLTPESGDLAARLLKEGLLPDDADTFTSQLLVDWATMAAAIKASKKFAKFDDFDFLPVPWLPLLIKSPLVSVTEVQAILRRLPSFLDRSSRAETQAIAEALVTERWRMNVQRIVDLRSSGASIAQIVGLVNNLAPTVKPEQLTPILDTLSDGYTRLGVGGRGRPTFPSDDAHKKFLDRFVGYTVKSVEERDQKVLGLRLVAHLKRVG